MDDNTAAVLALALMAATVVAVVWLIAWMRIRVRRTELEYDREHRDDDLTWPDGQRVRKPGEKRLER